MFVPFIYSFNIDYFLGGRRCNFVLATSIMWLPGNVLFLQGGWHQDECTFYFYMSLYELRMHSDLFTCASKHNPGTLDKRKK